MLSWGGEKFYLSSWFSCSRSIIKYMCTLFIKDFRSFVFEKSVPRFLPYFEADGVLGLLGLLEKFWDFLKAGICLLFLALCLFDIVEKEFVRLIIDFLRRSLRVRRHVVLQSWNPIYFLFRHLKYYIWITVTYTYPYSNQLFQLSLFLIDFPCYLNYFEVLTHLHFDARDAGCGKF